MIGLTAKGDETKTADKCSQTQLLLLPYPPVEQSVASPQGPSGFAGGLSAIAATEDSTTQTGSQEELRFHPQVKSISSLDMQLKLMVTNEPGLSVPRKLHSSHDLVVCA